MIFGAGSRLNMAASTTAEAAQTPDFSKPAGRGGRRCRGDPRVQPGDPRSFFPPPGCPQSAGLDRLPLPIMLSCPTTPSSSFAKLLPGANACTEGSHSDPVSLIHCHSRASGNPGRPLPRVEPEDRLPWTPAFALPYAHKFAMTQGRLTESPSPLVGEGQGEGTRAAARRDLVQRRDAKMR